MQKGSIPAKNIDEYIEGFAEEVQINLEKIRNTIKKIVPEAHETISYGMPAFQWKGTLVYFAAYKNHIGFYPMPTAIEAFKDELTGYKLAKGTIQFPINAPIPLDLIARIVKFRVSQNLEKSKTKK
jgi:uncharacterized protein YdhG (YjbR/CyaY superfamily)